MPYPQRLIPKTTDFYIKDLFPHDFLCRYTADSRFELRDQDGLLTAEAVEGNKFRGYSLNKIPPSEIEDIYIEFYDKTKFNQLWIEGENGIEPTFDDYFLNENRKFFFIKVGDIHGHRLIIHRL